MNRKQSLQTALVGFCASMAAWACAAAEPTLADRQAIEETLKRANVGFEISDPDLFASAFAADAVYELSGEGPVFGYRKMRYAGREGLAERGANALSRSPVRSRAIAARS